MIQNKKQYLLFYKLSQLLEKLWFIILTSSIIGALIFIAIYGIRILDPTYEDWLFQGGDLTQHYVGWLFFRKSEWQFPLGLIDGILGNIKVSIIYTDSIPIFALFFKLISPILPETFQYFGFLGILSFMLNGALSSLLIHCFKKNGIFCIIGSTFYIVCPAILQRLYGHEALSCHFIILIGLILWFYQNHKWEKKWKEYIMPPLLWGLLGAAAIGIHMYFLPMSYCFMIGCFITDIFKYKKYLRPVLCLISITSFSLITMWLLGAFYNNADIPAAGLGQFSANINTFWNPLEIGGEDCSGYNSKGSIFLNSLPVNYGQYEGYAYVGIGIILGAIISFIIVVYRAVRNRKSFVSSIHEMVRRRKAWLIAAAIVFIVAMFYSIGPSAYINDYKLYDIYYPESIIKIMSAFRATGRFAWIGMYLIITSVLYCISRMDRKKLMLGLLISCSVLQLVDMSSQISSRRWYKEKQIYTSPLTDSRWNELAEGRDKLIGLPYDQSPATIYTLSIFAYKHNMTINHFHIARPPFNEILEQYYNNINLISSGKADQKALYVFLDKQFIPEVEGEKIYELDGYYAVIFPGQHNPLE